MGTLVTGICYRFCRGRLGSRFWLGGRAPWLGLLRRGGCFYPPIGSDGDRLQIAGQPVQGMSAGDTFTNARVVVGVTVGADDAGFHQIVEAGAPVRRSPSGGGCRSRGFTRRSVCGGGDLLSVTYRSPNHTFDGQVALLAAQAFVQGFPPAGFPGFPELHVSEPGFVIFSLSPQLPSSGVASSFVIPPGLAGIGVRFQAVAFGSMAANGFFVASDAHDVLLQ